MITMRVPHKKQQVEFTNSLLKTQFKV